jgi:hypothetical protein
MITSFKDIASAMTRCVVIIEDYTRLSPSTLMDVAKPTITGTPPSEVKKERKARVVKEKDPNAPKRPPSAYLLFQNDVKDEIRKTHADIPYKDVLQVISAKWKELPPDQKKVRRLGQDQVSLMC